MSYKTAVEGKVPVAEQVGDSPFDSARVEETSTPPESRANSERERYRLDIPTSPIRKPPSSLGQRNEVFLRLQKQGYRDKWAVNFSDIKFINGVKSIQGTNREVYRVKWKATDCAAKICSVSATNQQITELAREIKIMYRLRHPHLVMFMGACFEPGRSPILLMEYCAGGSLEDVLSKLTSKKKKLRVELGVKYTLELAQGMNYLHQCDPPLIHHDLKPSNVLLTSGNEIKIADFGLSKYLPRDKNYQRDTSSMVILEEQSCRYLSPEIYKRSRYGTKADVYSFSLIVYWMLTGKRPFDKVEDDREAVELVSRQEIHLELNRVKPAGLRDILSDGCSLNPESRPTFEKIVEVVESQSKEATSGNCTIQ